ncbi:MAG: hypothetical protein Q4C70_05550 [Planctomycetia bacterium]|nr:hypothetical protein [Planctomycetia bacterium]
MIYDMDIIYGNEAVFLMNDIGYKTWWHYLKLNETETCYDEKLETTLYDILILDGAYEGETIWISEKLWQLWLATPKKRQYTRKTTKLLLPKNLKSVINER